MNGPPCNGGTASCAVIQAPERAGAANTRPFLLWGWGGVWWGSVWAVCVCVQQVCGVQGAGCGVGVCAGVCVWVRGVACLASQVSSSLFSLARHVSVVAVTRRLLLNRITVSEKQSDNNVNNKHQRTECECSSNGIIQQRQRQHTTTEE